MSKIILLIIDKNHNNVPAGIHAYDRACLFCHFLLKNKQRNKQKLWNISTTISYLLLATQGKWSKGFLPSSISWFCFAGLFSSAEKNAVVFLSLNPTNKHNSFAWNYPSAITPFLSFVWFKIPQKVIAMHSPKFLSSNTSSPARASPVPEIYGDVSDVLRLLHNIAQLLVSVCLNC